MNNALYIALSRQTALMRQMDVVANNVANVDTTGYRSEDVLFDEFMIRAKVDGKAGKPGELTFTHDLATVNDMSQGSLELTNRTFDLAIGGEGYFVIETPLGERYTRAGNFQLDAEGTLITAQGFPVLGEGGQRIVLDDIQGDVVIGEEGAISVNGEELVRVDVVQFDNEQLLEKVGNTLFKSDVPPLPGQNFRLIQGAVEKSNVKSVEEMNKMITVSRAVGSVNNFVSTMDELQLNAIRTLAKQN